MRYHLKYDLGGGEEILFGFVSDLRGALKRVEVLGFQRPGFVRIYDSKEKISMTIYEAAARLEAQVHG